MTEYNKTYENDSVVLARLWQKKSKAGNVYFSGTLGSARYSLVKTKFTSDSGEPVWELKVSPAKKNYEGQQQQPQQPVTRVVNSQRDEDEFMSEFMG